MIEKFTLFIRNLLFYIKNNYYKNRKIGNEIIAIILIFLIFSIIFIYSFTNYFVKNTILNKYMNNYLTTIHDNIERNVNNYIAQINQFSSVVTIDRNMYNVWLDNESSLEQKYEAFHNILSENLEGNKIISNIEIVFNNGNLFQYEDVNTPKIDSNFNHQIRSTGIAIYNNVVSDEQGEKYIVFGKRIIDFNTAYVLGNMYIYVNEKFISDIYSNLLSNKSSFAILSDEVIISHKDKNKLNHVYLLPQNVKIGKNNMAYMDKYVYSFKKMKLATSGDVNWTILSILSYDDLYSAVNKLESDAFLFTLTAIIFSVILAFLLSYSLISSMKQLKLKMSLFLIDETEIVDFKYREIAELEQSFDTMVKEITALIRKNNEEKEKQRVAEMNVLQAQINSHFIYNAMDGIHWLAKIHNQEYIAKMIYAVASFYRISLSKGNNIIKIKEELKHIECYIAIEQMRFHGLFDVTYQIDESILEYNIPKTILQPIVENCIKHGFDDIESGGEIIIKGYSVNDENIIFEIQDNGKGMGYSPIENRDAYNGYGIFNVHERLLMHFGEGYGLTYNSVVGKGTLVKIKVKNIVS